MAIKPIDEEKCIGCGKCVKSCPMDVIRFDAEKKKAVVVYVKECVCCYNCEQDCPSGAIYVDPRRAVHVPPAWA